MFRKKCLICNSQELKRIIDLGMHPFADTFVGAGYEDKCELIYPLQCDLCQYCGQIQTSCQTDPQDRYALRDYSYTSANSAYSRSHWQEYVRDVLSYADVSPADLIVEAGSNDGFVLKEVSDKGFSNCVGVDPSRVMAEEAKKKYGITTRVGLFEDVAHEPQSNLRNCKLIMANNVFNHSNDPVAFIKGVAEALDEDGCFVYELPYWVILLESKKFDQIYHEHVSYFTATSSYNLLRSNGLYIDKVEIVDYHGGSLRVYAKKGTGPINPSLQELMDRERELKVFSPSTYEKFMEDIMRVRSAFMKKVHDIKEGGGKIIAVGAAAKGNTFLNFYGLDNTLIECVTDASSFKQNKRTPLTRIPIYGDEVFSQYDEVHALILSWNISQKLKHILREINPDIKFMSIGEEVASE